MPATTPATLVNQALAEIAAQAAVTGAPPTFDGSPAGLQAGVLYQPLVNMLLREQEWEFARIQQTATAASGVAVFPPWTNATTYPTDCMRLLQVLPLGYNNNNDPQPFRWSVQFTEQTTQPAPVILTAGAAGYVVYQTNLITESNWDSVFTETFVRMLASELAMGVGGRPDFSKVKLQEGGQLMQTGAGRDS